MNQYTAVSAGKERMEIFGQDFSSALQLYRNLNTGIDPVQMYIEKQNIRVADNIEAPAFAITINDALLGAVYPASGNIALGSELILTAVPAAGASFSGWTIGGITVTDNPLRRVISEDTNILATFATI